MYFLRRMRRAHLPPPIRTTFYSSAIESTVWSGGCSASDWKNVRRVVRTAKKIIGTSFLSIQDIAQKRRLSRAKNITSDSTHPHHGLFSLLDSSRRFLSVRAMQDHSALQQRWSPGHHTAKLQICKTNHPVVLITPPLHRMNICTAPICVYVHSTRVQFILHMYSSYVQLSHVCSLLYCTVYRYFYFYHCRVNETKFRSVYACIYVNDNKVSLNLNL